MRFFIYLLALAAACTYNIALHAHDDRGSVVEGVRWHGHEHHRRGNRVLHEAFGSRTIWGIRGTDLHSYQSNRDRVTANAYDDVLVTYIVRDSDRRRRRRDDRGRRGATVAVGIAQFFSKYRMHEVAIEHFDRSRSRVIELGDISGVLLSHSRVYGNVTFNARALAYLDAEWQQRFPTDRGQRYRFYGRVAAVFSDANRLIEVHSVHYGRGNAKRLDNRPVALLHSDHLAPHHDRERRRDRDRDRDRDLGSINLLD